jgi:hypothetical protein
MKKSMVEYKKEIKDLKDMFNEEQKTVYNLSAERKKLKCVLSSVKEVLKTEISNKFRWETDWGFLDDMEMAIIDTMILNHKSKININMNTNQRIVKELQVSVLLIIVKIVYALQ